MYKHDNKNDIYKEIISNITFVNQDEPPIKKVKI